MPSRPPTGLWASSGFPLAQVHAQLHALAHAHAGPGPGPGPSSSRSQRLQLQFQLTPRSRSFTSTARRSARVHGSISHYDALKLSKNATRQQIKAKFYELSKLYHPDAKGGDTAKFHEINDAYAVLGDESKRRQYDLSMTPASQSHQYGHHAQSHRHGHGAGSHSSFTPHDPYLHRAAQGPHRAWSASSASQRASQGQSPRTEHYSPFGRRTPPNFQYTYEYNFQYNPNARRAAGAGAGAAGKRKAEGEDDEHAGTAGGGGMWKFVSTVGLILVVISLGGGLTANSHSQVDWDQVTREGFGQLRQRDSEPHEGSKDVRGSGISEHGGDTARACRHKTGKDALSSEQSIPPPLDSYFQG
ncbi:hypothetical protein IAU59_001074 [Kwoniella sp. CBS 9459]